jgi:multiple sugar transport system permease protein
MNPANERRQALLLAAPALATLAAVALYPLLATLWLSLHRHILVFGERSFLGGANFTFLVQDGRFWSALGVTAYFSVLSVLLELLIALPAALLLDLPFKGRGLLRAAVLVPWAIPTAVAAKVWAYLFHPDFGAVARLLPAHDVNWLGTPGYALHAAVLVDVWKTTPFVALLLLGGLQTIPGDLYRAARIDGAGALMRFRRITLPLLRPVLAVTLLFRLLDAFRVFDSVYILTEGGPANSTETLSIYAYKTLMRSGDFGYGSALALATFVCVALFSAGYLALTGATKARKF